MALKFFSERRAQFCDMTANSRRKRPLQARSRADASNHAPQTRAPAQTRGRGG